MLYIFRLIDNMSRQYASRSQLESRKVTVVSRGDNSSYFNPFASEWGAVHFNVWCISSTTCKRL